MFKPNTLRASNPYGPVAVRGAGRAPAFLGALGGSRSRPCQCAGRRGRRPAAIDRRSPVPSARMARNPRGRSAPGARRRASPARSSSSNRAARHRGHRRFVVAGYHPQKPAVALSTTSASSDCGPRCARSASSARIRRLGHDQVLADVELDAFQPLFARESRPLTVTLAELGFSCTRSVPTRPRAR